MTTLGILPLTIYIKTNDILLLSKIKQGGYDVNQLKVPDLSQPVRGGNCVTDQQTKDVVQQAFVYRTTRLVNLLKIGERLFRPEILRVIHNGELITIT